MMIREFILAEDIWIVPEIENNGSEPYIVYKCGMIIEGNSNEILGSLKEWLGIIPFYIFTDEFIPLTREKLETILMRNIAELREYRINQILED